jgi:hypothetical protein
MSQVPTGPGVASTTRHGYTFHETLDNLHLIHMSERVYDQVTGGVVFQGDSLHNLLQSLTACVS